jgi:hypothetical protein
MLNDPHSMSNNPSQLQLCHETALCCTMRSPLGSAQGNLGRQKLSVVVTGILASGLVLRLMIFQLVDDTQRRDEMLSLDPSQGSGVLNWLTVAVFTAIAALSVVFGVRRCRAEQRRLSRRASVGPADSPVVEPSPPHTRSRHHVHSTKVDVMPQLEEVSGSERGSTLVHSPTNAGSPSNLR